jgi:hypothetical protein
MAGYVTKVAHVNFAGDFIQAAGWHVKIKML